MMGGQWYNDNNRHIQKNILGANVKNPNNAERTSLYTHELQGNQANRRLYMDRSLRSSPGV